MNDTPGYSRGFILPEALAFAGPPPFSSEPPALLPRLPSCSQAISSRHPAPSGQPASPTLHKPAGGTVRTRIALPSRSHLAKHALQKPCPTGRQHSYLYNRNPFQHAHGSAWICSGEKVLAALIFQTLDMIPEFSLVGFGWELIHSFIHSFIQWWLMLSTIVSRMKTQSLRQTNRSQKTKMVTLGMGWRKAGHQCLQQTISLMSGHSGQNSTIKVTLWTQERHM